MRKITSMLLFAAASTVLLSSCSGLRRAAREPVEITICATAADQESADSQIKVDMSASMPERYRNVNTGILFEPVLVNAGGPDSAALKKAIAEGRFNNMYDRRSVRFKEQPKDRSTEHFAYTRYDDTEISWTASTPYEDWMEDCLLKTRIYAEAYGKRVLLKEECIPLSIKKLIPEQECSPAPEEALPKEEDNGPLFYRMQFTRASADLSGESDAMLLYAKLKEIVNDRSISDYHLAITVSNSPEGTMRYNTDLCARRRDAITDLIRKAGADIGKCDIIMIPENWDCLIEKAQGLIPDATEGLRKAVETISNADKREEHIRRNMNIDWTILSKIAYPELRYCHVTLTYTTDNR